MACPQEPAENRVVVLPGIPEGPQPPSRGGKDEEKGGRVDPSGVDRPGHRITGASVC